MLTSGCATITRGSDDTLQIISTPSGATVETTNGYSCGPTPCQIDIPRRSEFIVTVSKPGCETKQIRVTNQTSDRGAVGAAGNILLGGVIGLGVDAATGATQDLVPNPVEVRLNCS
ncbi:PEGA domain-containing protein [Pseudaestuariivita rosea]|uniref:PEGA domain-containing protein n=1 Tax=Pseudaestuariivita rosea TaxID=2763263 RepID=UPI001F20B0CA|nr:PEGA domain-containing protein [Pseudaestuariivita rosea]